MDRYKIIKLPKNNWIGLFSGSYRIKHFFSISWRWIHSSLHPDTEFAFSLFGFILPVIDRCRHLFFFRFFTWDKTPAAYLTFSFLYLPSIDFRIGNGRTWWYIRNENLHMWLCRRRTAKQAKIWLGE